MCSLMNCTDKDMTASNYIQNWNYFNWDLFHFLLNIADIFHELELQDNNISGPIMFLVQNRNLMFLKQSYYFFSSLSNKKNQLFYLITAAFFYGEAQAYMFSV